MTDMSMGEALEAWWSKELTDRNSGSARALRAKLRRASDPIDVLSERAVNVMAHLIKCDKPHHIVLIARGLAAIDEGANIQLARALGSGGEQAVMSPLRFKKLVGAREPMDLTAPLLRALPMVNRKCNVRALAEDLVWWGEDVRARWCFDYYQSALRDPQKDKEDEGETA